jgi:hypothetical protein
MGGNTQHERRSDRHTKVLAVIPEGKKRVNVI